MKCPNCKQEYKWNTEDRSHKKYPHVLTHYNQTCPFGLATYQKTKEKCKESVKQHILNKFPWMTEESDYLKD